VRAAILGAVLLALIAAIGVGFEFYGRSKKSAKQTAAQVASMQTAELARATRLSPAVGAVAPAPLPNGEPLTGEPGIDAAGYPKQRVDQAGLRSLLWHKRYETLNATFERWQLAFEADPRKEYWVLAMVAAFESADPELRQQLQRWATATPQHFAPYLARAAHAFAVAVRSRGDKVIRDTPAADIAAMDAAIEQSAKELDEAEKRRKDMMVVAWMRLHMERLSPKAGTGHYRVGERRCPTCVSLRHLWMGKLEPRWGGSYSEMDRFAKEQIARYGKSNPRFASLSDASTVARARELFFANKVEEALQTLDSLTGRSSSSALVLRAELYLHQKKFSEALQTLDLITAPDTRKGPVDLPLLRARAHLGLEQPVAASQLVLQAMRVDSTDRDAGWLRDACVSKVYNMGFAAYAGDRHEDAVKLSELVNELAPDLQEGHALHYHAVLGRNPNRPGAEAELIARLKARPDDVRAVQDLDYFLSETRQWERILGYWDDYLRRHPDDARALLERAGTHHQLGHHDEARRDATRACELGLNEACGHAR
jgi:tetratricopeptide (TPR) repeat protein